MPDPDSACRKPGTVSSGHPLLTARLEVARNLRQYRHQRGVSGLKVHCPQMNTDKHR
jgi:hypothetical protein